MDLIQIANEIQNRINLLAAGRKELQKRAETKAQSLGLYEKELGITILKLENGGIKEHEGQDCTKIGKTNMEKIAKAICWDFKVEADLAEATHKNAIVGMQSIQAELNALQSLLKYLEEV